VRDDPADDYTARYGAEGARTSVAITTCAFCKMLRRSFPDVAISIEELIVEGDRID